MKGSRHSTAIVGTVIAWSLAACGSPAPSTSAPGSEGEQTASAEASDPAPQPGGSAPPDIGDLTQGAVVQVVADELRLRAEASPTSTLVGTLERGAVVRVESGPVDAEGFSWFEVVDLRGHGGWAADGDGTDPWLATIPDLAGQTPMLTLTYGCDVVAPINPPATTVMDDGRVIATAQPAGYGWTERQLSASGLDDLREAVLGSPYLQASGEYVPRLRPDAGDPPGHGACSYTFTIPNDAEPIVVTTVGWFGDDEERTFYEPSPERKSLDGIARNLIEIDTALGDEAWEGPGLPYVAAAYTLHLAPGIGPAPEDVGSIDPGGLGVGDIGSFGSAAGSGRCDAVSRAQAFEIARVILGSGGSQDVRLDVVSYPYFTTDDGWYSGALAPVFPNGQPDCASITL
jgi:hypothetical protein